MRDNPGLPKPIPAKASFVYAPGGQPEHDAVAVGQLEKGGDLRGRKGKNTSITG